MAGAITIDALEIVIEKKSSDAAKKVTDLAKALKELKSSLSGNTGKNFATLAENLNSFTKSINKLDIAKLTKMANAIAKLSTINNLRSIVNAVNSNDSKAAKEMIEEEAKMKMGEQVESPETPSSTSKELKNVNRDLAVIGQPTSLLSHKFIDVNEFLNMASAADVLKGKIGLLKEELSQLINSGNAGQSKEKIINLTGQIQNLEKQLSNLGNDKSKKASKTTKENTKSISKFNTAIKALGKSLLRVAGYRAIRALLKAITSAFKEGIDSVYTYSRLVGGEFASSMDSITTSVFYLKNSIGAALVPIIQALAPAIETACDWLANLATEIGAVAAIVSGNSVYTVATKQAKQYIEYANKAQNVTLGIDELNTVSNNDKTDYSTLFTEESTDNATETAKSLAEVINGIKDIIEKIVEIVEPIVKELAPDTKELVISILDAVADILEALKPIILALTKAIKNLLPKVMPLITKIIQVIIKAIDKFTPVYLKLIDTMMPIWEDIFAIMEQNLIPIIEVIVELVFKLINFLGDKLPILEPVLKTIMGIIKVIADAIKLIVDALTGNWDDIDEDIKLIEKDFGNLCDTVVDGSTTAFGGVATKAEDAFDNVGKTIRGWLDVYQAWLKDVKEEIVDAFETAGTAISNAFVTAWNTVKTFFTVTVKNWFTETIPNFFKKVGIDIANAIITGLNKLGNFTIPGLKIGDLEIWGDTQVKLFNIPLLSYATGGFPNQGQLFIANEAGAEMVGSMDGKTAVANNQQIVEGIKQGVFEAVMSAMANREDNGGNFNITVDLDGKQIESRISSITRENGLSIGAGVVFG